MTAETNNSTNVADKMKSVEAAWDKAPSGPRTDATLKHAQAAEKAQTAENDADTNKELEAATPVLG